MRPTCRRPHKGFLLLEVVLALAVFGMAATGFAVAIHRMAELASLAQSELRITRTLESALDATLSLPVLEEGVTTDETLSEPDGSGFTLVTNIEILDEMENQDGQLLQEMFRITITATWFENSAWQERSVETWRYGRMYQP